MSVRSAFSNEVPLIVWLYTQQTEFSLCGRWILRPGCQDGGVLVKVLSRSQMAASSLCLVTMGKRLGEWDNIPRWCSTLITTQLDTWIWGWYKHLIYDNVTEKRWFLYRTPRPKNSANDNYCVKSSFTSLGLRRAKWQRCCGRLTYRTSEALNIRCQGMGCGSAVDQ